MVGFSFPAQEHHLCVERDIALGDELAQTDCQMLQIYLMLLFLLSEDLHVNVFSLPLPR